MAASSWRARTVSGGDMEGGWVERTEPGARRTWEAGVESSGFITFVFDNAVSRGFSFN